MVGSSLRFQSKDNEHQTRKNNPDPQNQLNVNLFKQQAIKIRNHITKNEIIKKFNWEESFGQRS